MIVKISRKDHTYMYGRDFGSPSNEWKLLKVNLSPPPYTREAVQLDTANQNEFDRIEFIICEHLLRISAMDKKYMHANIFVSYGGQQPMRATNITCRGRQKESTFYLKDSTSNSFLPSNDVNEIASAVKELIMRCTNKTKSVNIIIKVSYSEAPLRKSSELLWIKAAQKFDMTESEKIQFQKEARDYLSQKGNNGTNTCAN